MLLIYVPHITPRIQYVFDLFFNNIVQLRYTVITDREEFLQHTGAKISYAETAVGDELFFKSTALLLETGVRYFELTGIDVREGDLHLKGFFATEQSALPFDVFASAFYLVSRYEEHLGDDVDHHGRFHAHNSVAYQQFFLLEPMVDLYAQVVVKRIQDKFSVINMNRPAYDVLNTIDVDMAWKYQHKGVVRNTGGFLNDLFKGNLAHCLDRVGVLFGRKADPFHSFDFLEQTEKETTVPIRFFWLLGDHGEYDKNTSVQKNPFRLLIHRFKAKSGVHFSYGSHSSLQGFKEEQQRFQSITGDIANSSRFHFLKYSVEKDFSRLIEAGIRFEYSMGYAMHEGFRASIARPFLWFSLKENKTTELTIVPFMFMDASFRYHDDLKDEEIKEKIVHVMRRTKAVNGKLVTLWHNDTFEEKRNNWKSIYLWFNKTAK